MRPRTLLTFFAFGLAVGIATSASAVVVAGGGPKKSDCYAGFEVESEEGPVTVTGKAKNVVNGTTSRTSCTFDVRLCINEPVAGCTAATVTSFVDKKAVLPQPALGSTRVCGDPKPITVNLGGKKTNKPRSLKIHVVAKTSDGKPKNDPDNVILHCSLAPPFCSVVIPPADIPCTSVPANAATCPPNPAGGPNEADVTVATSGTDLDNGWTGTSHNFPVVGGSQLKLCLVGCDDKTNPLCGLCGPTGGGSLNTATFGPPLPLLAANVPVCVTNRFVSGEIVRGSADLSTGDTSLVVDLLSDVFLTTAGEVCPRCTNNQCTSGPNEGKACTVEGTVTVAQAAGDKVYGTSRACPPSSATSQFAGTLKIHLPLTTGKAVCNGPLPCTAQPGDPSTGIPVQDDQCGGALCNASCTGLACTGHTPDGQCLDSKGGISQFCCSNDTTKPCYPTKQVPGVAGNIERTGIANPLTPPWGDGIYPKTGNGTVVSTFCEPATTSNTINTTTGLPGPGALILPGMTVVTKQ